MRMVNDAKDDMLHNAILVITTGVAFFSIDPFNWVPTADCSTSDSFFIPFSFCVVYVRVRESARILGSRNANPGPVRMIWHTGITTLSILSVYWPAEFSSLFLSLLPFLFFPFNPVPLL